MNAKPSFYHFGLTVTNLERSRKFYCNVAGFALEYEYALGNDDFDKLIGNQGLKIQFVYLLLGSFRLQLIEYTAGGHAERLALEHNKVGNPHLSLWVPDIQEKHSHIARTDPSVTMSPIVTQKYDKIGTHSFYVFDPDGIQIEFVEKLYDYVSSTVAG